MDIYFSSVGRGCVLNLGIAPNREGLVGEDDVRRLKEFGDWVREFNAVDHAKGATVKMSENRRFRADRMSPEKSPKRFWDGLKIFLPNVFGGLVKNRDK